MLVLLAVMALLYAWAAHAGLLGLVLAGLLTLIACRYGGLLLEHAANGEPAPPTLELDMLAPTDPRVLIPLAGAGCAAWFWLGLAGPAGKALALLLLAALPLTMGLVAIDGWRARAFLPWPLLRTGIALGPHYLLLLGAIAGIALLAGRAVAGGTGGLLSAALALYLLWAACALIGRVFYERRFELGYEPAYSPEREAERAARERSLARGHFIDELYVAARMRKPVEGRALLAARLACVPQEFLVEECTALYSAAAGWQLPRALGWVAEVLLTTLLAHGQPEAALALATRLLHEQPQFRFELAGQRETLQQLALQSGRKELAARLALPA